MIESVNRLLEASAGRISLGSVELDRLVKDLLWFATVDFSTGALDALLQGGNLPSIQNSELRQRPTVFTHLIDWTRTKDARKGRWPSNVWIPYLRKNASIAQLHNASHKGPGIDAIIGRAIIPTREHRNHSTRLEDNEFHGLSTSKFMS